jgi:hypothetical protein
LFFAKIFIIFKNILFTIYTTYENEIVKDCCDCYEDCCKSKEIQNITNEKPSEGKNSTNEKYIITKNKFENISDDFIKILTTFF